MNALLILGALALAAKVAMKPKGIPGRWYVRAQATTQVESDESLADVAGEFVSAFYDGTLTAIYEPVSMGKKDLLFAVELAGEKPPGKGVLSVPGGTLKILESRPLKLSEDESRESDREGDGGITIRKW
jgi:hypothetical protein